MLNRAILELNGIFNVNPNGSQRQNTGTVAQPLQEPLQAAKERQYVHPRLFKEEIYETMQNYREAREVYNKKVKLANAEIEEYNAKVELQRKEKPLTRAEQMALVSFYKLIKKEIIWERNKRIEAYNKSAGKLIAPKEKIHTIKYHTQNVMEAILLHYSMQLRNRYFRRKQLNLHFTQEIPLVELHSGWITDLKANGVIHLDVCQKTFRRQRKRLTEAGILVDYTFEGSARPVKMHINPSILSLRELHEGKKTSPENQEVNKGGRTLLPDNNDSNRSFRNNKEIKANVNKHSGERSSLSLTSLNFSSIGNTRENYAEKNDAAQNKKRTGAEKNTDSAKKNTLSQFLRQKLEEKNDLADQLAAHQHDNYTPIRKEILEKEAFSGSLTREEFKELVLQDFFKTAAKLYKGATPYKASWLKAYNTWMQEKFITNAGHCLSKQNMLTRIPELRYGLAAVARYLKRHKNYNILFPGEYFDLTRTTAKEGGFKYYAGEAWRKHQAYLKTKKTNTKTTAAKRKRRLTALQKAEKHVKSYLKNKIDLQELFTKVEQLGNKAVIQDLPELIRKMNDDHQSIKYSHYEL